MALFSRLLLLVACLLTLLELLPGTAALSGSSASSHEAPTTTTRVTSSVASTVAAVTTGLPGGATLMRQRGPSSAAAPLLLPARLRSLLTSDSNVKPPSVASSVTAHSGTAGATGAGAGSAGAAGVTVAKGTAPSSSSVSSTTTTKTTTKTSASSSTSKPSAGSVPQAAPKLCDPAGFKPKDGKPYLYLYVWAGIEGARGGTTPAAKRDFVATVDVTAGSPCFGQVISESEVPFSGNEPHHVGLNINGTVLGVGGFNSWHYNQPSMYFFDVATNPAAPKFIKSLTPVLGATTDDFFRLPNGGFLVSLMGNTKGGSSGRVAEISPGLDLVAEHPRSGKNIEGFNPHGLALTPGPQNRMVTLDYVEYGTTFKPSTEIKYRTTARVWDQSTREIIKVIDLGPQAKGLMTARYIPGSNAKFLITAGHGVLYELDAQAGTAKPIHDFKVGEGHCVLTAPFKNSTRVIVSLYTTDQVQLLDISTPGTVKTLQTLDLPKGTGPHATVLAPGERLLAITTYYVQHPAGEAFAEPFTNVNERGLRLYEVAADGNSFKPHPDVPYVDFKSLFPHRGVARPHGMAFKSVATA